MGLKTMNWFKSKAMIIAAAQTKPISGDIDGNILDHLRLMKLAADKNVDLIVFPELSLTGYQRALAASLSFSTDDSRLDRLRQAAVDWQLVVVAGAPIKMEDQLYIGAFILYPDYTMSFYIKQFLHDGEELFYQSSPDYNPIIEIGDERIALAICADINHAQHPQQAKAAHASLYAASIFYTPNGISEAYELLSRYAKIYSMAVLMSNYTGSSWELAAGGCSAFWNNRGELISSRDASSAGLLLMQKDQGNWIDFS